MAGSDSDVAVRRSKREDCQRTELDSAFSTWKVLVGPTDWEDYSLGKEGSSRYRLHHLPTSPGPGIYELGVAASRAKSGREIAKLDPRLIVVVYLGQADCVRTRLQQYGRSGAHLGRCSPVACETDGETSFPTGKLGLFEGMLSRGNPIVYRWAPLHDKEDARREELSLLDKFDYAWNKGSNGSRRPCDIFWKLDEIESSNFSNEIFKFSKSRPRPVISESRANKTAISGGYPANESFSPICGVILEDGFPCTKPPVHGRQRCSRHKGMRIRASNSGSYAKDTAISGGYPANESFSPLCGVILEDGFPCTKPPVQGRERCSEHKGMRIRASSSGSYANDTAISGGYPANESFSRLCGVILEDGFPCTKPPAQGRERCSEHKGMRIRASSSGSYANDTAILGGYPANESFSPLCGVILEDGSPCTKPPVQGRERCSEHKGMRIRASNSAPRRKGASSEINEPGNMRESFSQQGNYKNDFGAACGVDLGDGTFCMRRAAQGRVRCELHKGMRIGAPNSAPRRNGASSGIHGLGNMLAFSQQGSVINDFGAVCGVHFGDGTFCTRRAAPGRVRCERHKGMRVN